LVYYIDIDIDDIDYVYTLHGNSETLQHFDILHIRTDCLTHPKEAQVIKAAVAELKEKLQDVCGRGVPHPLSGHIITQMFNRFPVS